MSRCLDPRKSWIAYLGELQEQGAANFTQGAAWKPAHSPVGTRYWRGNPRKKSDCPSYQVIKAVLCEKAGIKSLPQQYGLHSHSGSESGHGTGEGFRKKLSNQHRKHNSGAIAPFIYFGSRFIQQIGQT